MVIIGFLIDFLVKIDRTSFWQHDLHALIILIFLLVWHCNNGIGIREVF